MNAKVEKAGIEQQILLQGAGVILLDGADIPSQNLPGGDLRIPVISLGADLDYEIPPPTAEYARDTLTVSIRVKGNPSSQFDLMTKFPLGPVADRQWPRPFKIPVARLVELSTPEAPTEYELVYVLYANGVNPNPEAVTEYHIDKTKPFQVKNPPSDFSPPAAAFPIDLPSNKEIDDEYIGNNPGGIVITLPTAHNYHPADKVDVYWGNPLDPAYSTPVLTGEDVQADGKITLPITIFENSKEGLNTLTFVEYDLAGNLSRRSRPNQRTVRRLALPVATPPIVPLADGTDGDTLIDLKDCKQGVTVEVPVPQPSSPNDLIFLYWAGRKVGAEQRVGNNRTLVFNVDYTTVIKFAYGATDGEVPTHINYDMVRGAGNIVAKDKTDIFVDISYPGPTNPGEPDPVNPDLELPRLVSSQDVDNELDDNDYGKDADIYIQLYSAPPTEAGQSITVWYDDNELAPYFLQPGEEGTEIKAATVAWDIIAKKPSATVKLKWSLSAVGGNNPIWSLEEDVTVNVAKIDLPMPQVQNLEGDSIACPTLNFVPPGDGTNRRNLKVIIPNSPSLLDGRTVTLKWQGFEDEEATIPISGTLITKDFAISGTVPPTGIEMDIGDYVTHLKPVSDGFGKLTYTVTGVVPDSDPAIHFVFLQDNNNDYCEVANPIPAP